MRFILIPRLLTMFLPFIIAIILLGSCQLNGQSQQHTFHSNNFHQIDSIVNDHIEQNNFTGVVMIADKGVPVYQKAAGEQHFSSNELIGQQTKFSIASITKMVTAIIILQLEEEEKLSVHDPIRKWLPVFPIINKEEITLHHLLLHISGLPNEDDVIYDRSVSPDDFINFTLLEGEQNEVGSFNYANIDYILLGKVIEKVTGKSWENNVAERILQPLNMKSTGFLKKDNYPKNFAYSYQIDKEGKSKQDRNLHIENYWAAGNMYSTASDLLKLDQAMYDDQFLSAKTKEKMFTSYPEYNYTGYSVWTYRYPFLESQPLLMERRGGILGANVVLVRILEHNKTIIILSNNNFFNPDSFGDKDNLKEALIITSVN